jgi:hypothetical protein
MSPKSLRTKSVMNTELELSESKEGARSSALREEQVFDEQAMSRMDDEGCPDCRQQGDPRQDSIGIGVKRS